MTGHVVALALIFVTGIGHARTADPVRVGVASFNAGWAGTAEDFQAHLKVCKAVAWCDTRPRRIKGETAPTPASIAAARQCENAVEQSAGGPAQAMQLAPCNAYKPDIAGTSDTPANYAVKLAGLQATVAMLIEKEKVQVIAFQEVKSDLIVRQMLGKFAARFDTCAAPHTAFQTVAFAWDRQLSTRPGICSAHQPLAIKENAGDSAPSRSVRPGLELTLFVHGEKVTFMNIHLKSSCANLITNPFFAGHKLTDRDTACQVLNRQVPVLEDWIDAVSGVSPRFMLLGDFNRNIEEEARQNVPSNKVRSDGSDPAGPNVKDRLGYVTSDYLWQEIADRSPPLYQVPLSVPDASCKGFSGLDHMVLSAALKSAQGTTPLNSWKVGVASVPKQKIETSDHCPRIMTLVL